MIKNLLKEKSVEGTAKFENNEFINFQPTAPVKVANTVIRGILHQGANGSVTFEPRAWSRGHARIIKLLEHGRLTERVDGDLQLTIRIPRREFWEADLILLRESEIAAEVVNENYVYKKIA